MKFLFIDTTHPLLKEKFKKVGIQCDYFPDLNYDKVFNIIHQYDGIIIRSKITLDAKILKKATHLKCIGRVGSGMENIDINTASELGIVCFNSPEGNRDAVAEHALGMMLTLFNNLLRANMEVKQGIWKREENRGIEIKGKNIGIIGYGNTGSAFAQKLSGLEANVMAYDKYKSHFSSSIVKEVTLQEIQKYCDIISFHVPLTQETHYLFNSTFIAQCANPFYLINTSRGPIVNTHDLIQALKSKKVKGAMLDVIEYEETSFEKVSSFPPEFHELASFENVLLSPHIAGWTYESKIKLAEILADKILKYLNLA